MSDTRIDLRKPFRFIHPCWVIQYRRKKNVIITVRQSTDEFNFFFFSYTRSDVYGDGVFRTGRVKTGWKTTAERGYECIALEKKKK